MIEVCILAILFLLVISYYVAIYRLFVTYKGDGWGPKLWFIAMCLWLTPLLGIPLYDRFFR